MNPYRLIVLSLLSLLLSGCLSKEKVYEGVYEGLKNREQIVHPSKEPVPQKLPDYGQYKRERETILQENK